MITEKICLRCGKKFFKPYTESKKAWINRHIYCSVKCRYPEPTIRKCQFCSKKFRVKGKERRLIAKFCSRECKTKSQKGKRVSQNTEFKKGHIPWSKGTKGLVVAWNKGKKFPYRSRPMAKGYTPWNKGKKLLHLSGENACHWKGGKKEKICIFCGKEFYVNKCRENTAQFCSRSCFAKSRKGELSANWKGGITPENHKIRHSLEANLWRKSIWIRDNFTCQKCQKKGGYLVAHHINNFAEFPELRFAIDNGITFCEKCHRTFHKKYGNKNNTKEQLLEFLIRK